MGVGLCGLFILACSANPFEGSRFDSVPSFEGWSGLPRAPALTLRLNDWFLAVSFCHRVATPSSVHLYGIAKYSNRSLLFPVTQHPPLADKRMTPRVRSQDILFLDTAVLSRQYTLFEMPVFHIGRMDP